MGKISQNSEIIQIQLQKNGDVEKYIWVLFTKKNLDLNLDLIGSAVLTFIGYKQTKIQTDRKSIHIHWFLFSAINKCPVLNVKIYNFTKQNIYI